jgi:tellurite resistance protein TehA-like permease
MTTNGHPQPTTMASQSALATLFPGYFALVMAAGIISLAAHFLGLPHIAQVLFWVNMTSYVVLWVLTVLRLVYYRAQLLDDLTHHARGVTFLTTVAGTCILGNQFAVLTPFTPVAVGLWCTGLVLRTVLLYTFFTAVTVREPKPSLETGINGAWLLVVVSTESLCVLGTLVAPAMAVTELVLFVALAMYLVGAMLYILFITLILSTAGCF